MPTYDYQCSDCKSIHEFFHSIKAEPEKTCPKCGKDKLQRLISGGVGLIFKGSGWTPRSHSDISSDRKADMEKVAGT